MDIFCRLLEISEIEFYKDCKLSAYSSFNIGGKANLAVFPDTEEKLVFVIRNCINNGYRFEVIGNASNVLFSDDGYRGIIIFTKNINAIKVNKESNTLLCSCGAKLVSVSNKALDFSLSGFEFAHGIPGSIGGAIYMNAGAYGSQISDIVVESYAYDTKRDCFVTISAEEHQFGYRQSVYMKNKELVCLGALLKLSDGRGEQIEALIHEYTQKRRNSQPLQFHSAGSYFKRPEAHFAGKLIEDCGLKGVSVGGACVSEKHAGFIINTGNATAKDVLSLAELIKERVYERFSVMLESEVQYIE